MTYFLRNNNSDIKITNVSVGWLPQYADAPITIQKESVFATNGTLYNPDNLYQYPTTRTFSYNTGWDYVQIYPPVAELGTGARAYSECQYIISSMALNWVTFGTWLNLDLI